MQFQLTALLVAALGTATLAAPAAEAGHSTTTNPAPVTSCSNVGNTQVCCNASGGLINALNCGPLEVLNIVPGLGKSCTNGQSYCCQNNPVSFSFLSY
jgi:hypothetical protein